MELVTETLNKWFFSETLVHLFGSGVDWIMTQVCCKFVGNRVQISIVGLVTISNCSQIFFELLKTENVCFINFSKKLFVAKLLIL